MTQKDYVIIADSLAVCIEVKQNDLETMERVIEQIGLDLLRDNPRFKINLFRKEIKRYAHELSFSLYRDRVEPRVDQIIAG